MTISLFTYSNQRGTEIMTTLSIQHIVRTTLRSALCLVCVLTIAIAPVQAQDNLVAYFPLDGDPAPGQFYAPGGEPQTVPGKIGDALQFDGGAVIALPHDLGQYPQLTFTAWVRLTDPELMDGKLVSSGRQPGPETYLQRGNVDLHAGRRSLDTNVQIPIDEWTFVAGVADFSASEARVHQGEIVETSSGEIETDLSRLQPAAYEDPDDPQAGRQRFIFIGARDFNLSSTAAHPAVGIAIDDVRIYRAALSEDKIEVMRTNPEPLAIGAYPPPPDDEEDEDPGVGGDEDTDGDGDNDSTGGNDGDDDTSGSGEGQNEDGDDNPGDGGELKLIGVLLDPEFYISRLSGDPAQYTKTVDLETAPAQRIKVSSDRSGPTILENRPCYINLTSSAQGNPFEFDVTYEASGVRYVSYDACGTPGFDISVSFEDGYYIRSLRVCQNNRNNNRIKGLEARAVRVVLNEYTNEIDFRDVATSSDSRPNCKEWRQTIRCGDDAVASGVRVRYDRLNDSTASFTGLELVCRKVIPRYEY